MSFQTSACDCWSRLSRDSFCKSGRSLQVHVLGVTRKTRHRRKIWRFLGVRQRYFAVSPTSCGLKSTHNYFVEDRTGSGNSTTADAMMFTSGCTGDCSACRQASVGPWDKHSLTPTLASPDSFGNWTERRVYQLSRNHRTARRKLRAGYGSAGMSKSHHSS